MTPFKKYSANGNDFVLISAHTPPSKELVQRICHRRFGVGADGVLVIEDSSLADFRLRIFNSDGNEADMCGNALRCVTLDQGLARNQKKFSIQVNKSVYEAQLDGGISEVRMVECFDVDTIDLQDLASKKSLYLNTGVPHAVFEVNDLKNFDVSKEGKKIREESRFPAGTNVSYFEKQGDQELDYRVFERGVEAETYCCGTGVTAVAIACHRFYGWTGNIKINTLGGPVAVEVDAELKKVLFKGKVDLCFEGTWCD